MDGNSYLIPANSKKSMLILGFFTGVDLMIFCFGIGISLFLLMFWKNDSLYVTLLLASPAMLAALLVAPVPNYHHVRTLIGNMNRFMTGRKKYYWRGWCVRNGNK